MRTLKIDINNEETINYIERLHYEVEQRKDIIQRLIEAHANDSDATVLTSPAFKAYSTELSEFVAEYETAKQLFEEEYVPKYLEGHQYNWSLNFAAKQLQIDILCDCDIPELH